MATCSKRGPAEGPSVQLEPPAAVALVRLAKRFAQVAFPLHQEVNVTPTVQPGEPGGGGGGGLYVTGVCFPCICMHSLNRIRRIKCKSSGERQRCRRLGVGVTTCMF